MTEGERDAEPDVGYRSVLDGVADLVVLVDPDGRVTYANAASERLLGVAPETLVGEPLVRSVHEADADAVEQLLSARASASTAADAPRSVEARARSADDGDRRWLAFVRTARQLASSDAVVVTVQDVTERRRREGRITAQNERLERFAATVSHDLQTPLSVASGSLELYRRTGDETSLERVDRALQRMSELTSDLLGLAREGRRVEDPDPVDLSTVAAAALETSPLPADGVAVHPDLPTVLGSEVRVRSLFENLFRNVADHAGPDARVWVAPLTDGDDSDDGDGDHGDAVGFVVEDDGPGIAADDAESVFELGTSSDHDGTGIGLHVVDTIASAHGWDVSVTAGRHDGARFEFRGVDVAPGTDADGADGGVTPNVDGEE
jgi:PAS domain S-box-containing protein